MPFLLVLYHIQAFFLQLDYQFLPLTSLALDILRNTWWEDKVLRNVWFNYKVESQNFKPDGIWSLCCPDTLFYRPGNGDRLREVKIILSRYVSWPMTRTLVSQLPSCFSHFSSYPFNKYLRCTFKVEIENTSKKSEQSTSPHTSCLTYKNRE